MNKRKILALVMVVTLVSALVAACAAPAPAPAPTPAPAPAPAAPSEVITWKGQHDNPAAGPSYIWFEETCNAITEASGGRLVMKAFAAGGVVPDDKEFDAVNRRVLDFGFNASSLWRDKFPEATMFNAIFDGPSPMEFWLWYVHGEGTELINKMVEGYNVLVVPGYLSIGEVFIYSKVPLETVADYDGIKARLFGDEAEIFGQIGVRATAVPSGEVYESIQRGVLDAFQHANLNYDIQMGFYEIVDYAYISGLRQAADPSMIIFNTDSWAELPDDLKTLQIYMWQAAAIKYYADTTYLATEATSFWRDKGVTVKPVPQEILDELSGIAVEYYAKRRAEEPFFAEIYDSMMDYRDGLRGAFDRL